MKEHILYSTKLHWAIKGSHNAYPNTRQEFADSSWSKYRKRRSCFSRYTRSCSDLVRLSCR